MSLYKTGFDHSEILAMLSREGISQAAVTVQSGIMQTRIEGGVVLYDSPPAFDFRNATEEASDLMESLFGPLERF